MQPGARHGRLLLKLAVLVIGMFGFGFALVPIYNTLCKTLGINGKIGQQVALEAARSVKMDAKRQVTVEFVATNNEGVQWAFYPETRKVSVHPGEVARLSFYAENRTDHSMVVQAVPNVTPAIAAKYLKKTECFCFTQQTLNGHEAMHMPLLFHLDPELPENIRTVTLSYTLFDVTHRK